MLNQEAIKNRDKLDGDAKTLTVPQIINFMDVNKRRVSLLSKKGSNIDLATIERKKRSCCHLEVPKIINKNEIFASDTTSEVVNEDNFTLSKWKKKSF